VAKWQDRAKWLAVPILSALVHFGSLLKRA